MTRSVHLHRHDGLTVPLTVLLHYPITSMTRKLQAWRVNWKLSYKCSNRAGNEQSHSRINLRCKILTRTRDTAKRMIQWILYWRAKGVNRKGPHLSVYVCRGLSSGISICIFCLHRVFHCTTVKWKGISTTFRKTLRNEGLLKTVKKRKLARMPEPKKS